MRGHLATQPWFGCASPRLWLVVWLVGWLVRSFVGWFVGWFVGSLVRWFVGSLVRWFVGSLVRWFVGSLGPCLLRIFRVIGALLALQVAARSTGWLASAVAYVAYGQAPAPVSCTCTCILHLQLPLRLRLCARVCVCVCVGCAITLLCGCLSGQAMGTIAEATSNHPTPRHGCTTPARSLPRLYRVRQQGRLRLVSSFHCRLCVPWLTRSCLIALFVCVLVWFAVCVWLITLLCCALCYSPWPLCIVASSMRVDSAALQAASASRHQQAVLRKRASTRRNCIICFERMSHPATAPCGHVFCWACIIRATQASVSGPASVMWCTALLVSEIRHGLASNQAWPLTDML